MEMISSLTAVGKLNGWGGGNATFFYPKFWYASAGGEVWVEGRPGTKNKEKTIKNSIHSLQYHFLKTTKQPLTILYKSAYTLKL